MRVLMVLHAPPCSPALGPARRHLHVFEEISRRHSVSIVTLGTPLECERFGREHTGHYDRAIFIAKRPRAFEVTVAAWYAITLRCAFRRLYMRPVQRAIDRLLAGGGFDTIYFSTLMLGYYEVPAGIRVIGDAHNVEHELLVRVGSIAPNPLWRTYCRLQAGVTRRDEERFARRVSQVWATSVRDAERFAMARGDTRVAVVPNGVRCDHRRDADDSAAQFRAVRPSAPVILFVGLMSYFPNRDAATYFLDEIFPLITPRIPSARCLVVGDHPPRCVRARTAGNVAIVGRVSSVAPYFARASVFVAPLRAGGGTRVKILEAMLHDVPVVSTTIGCEGLNVRNGESVLVADTPADFADAVVRLCSDAALSRRLAKAGASLVHAEYDWRRIGESLNRLLVQGREA